jgi:hypothetical protein
MRAVETTHPDPAPVLEVFPTRPPRHRMPQQTHAPNKCEAAISTCLLCGGPYAAWSRSCPSIKTAPITEETPIAPTIVMNPPAVIADPDITLNEPVEPPISAKQTIAFGTNSRFHNVF